MIGVYIHIPFCVRKCLYCDFYSVADDSLHAPFVEALIKEIERTEPLPEQPDTLYFGGGTPSVLSPSAIGRILEAVNRCYSFSDGSEVTLEVNPGTVSPESLKAYRRAGVNRLNIGVQSFDDGALSFLGRCHDGSDARNTVTWARSAGFENVGLDLIYGLPDQSPRAWRETMAEGVRFSPEHLSCYLLTYEAGTPLEYLRLTGKVDPMGEEDAAALFDMTVEELTRAGYEHYEISNFARRSGFRSRHNQKYWNHTPYVGFGPAAHSFDGRERYWNVKDVSEYIERLSSGRSGVVERETLTPEQLIVESIYLGLRTSDGIDMDRFQERFDLPFEALFEHLLPELQSEKLLVVKEGACALTPKGMRFHEYITGRFLDEL